MSIKPVLTKYLAENSTTTSEREQLQKFVEFAETQKVEPQVSTLGQPSGLGAFYGAYLPREGIVCIDGKYKVTIMIQDGYENCGEYTNEADAKKAWCDSQKVLNHRDVTEADAPKIIRLQPVYQIVYD